MSSALAAEACRQDFGENEIGPQDLGQPAEDPILDRGGPAHHLDLPGPLHRPDRPDQGRRVKEFGGGKGADVAQIVQGRQHVHLEPYPAQGADPVRGQQGGILPRALDADDRLQRRFDPGSLGAPPHQKERLARRRDRQETVGDRSGEVEKVGVLDHEHGVESLGLHRPLHPGGAVGDLHLGDQEPREEPTDHPGHVRRHGPLREALGPWRRYPAVL